MRTEQEYMELKNLYLAQVALNKQMDKLLKSKQAQLDLAENSERNLNILTGIMRAEFQSLKDVYLKNALNKGETTAERMS